MIELIWKEVGLLLRDLGGLEMSWQIEHCLDHSFNSRALELQAHNLMETQSIWNNQLRKEKEALSKRYVFYANTGASSVLSSVH